MLNPQAWGLGGDPFFQRCHDPVTLATISTAATIAGSAVSAAGTIAAGKSAKQSAEYEAQQLDLKGKEELAQGQQEAAQFRRNKDLALSTLQNRAAGSGFSATDPSSLALADEIEKYGSLQEQMAMYGAKSRRTGLEAQATGRRMEGSAARKGASYSAASTILQNRAASTILGGISTLADRFNPPRRPQTPSYRYG